MTEKRVPWGKVLQDLSPSSIAPGPPDDTKNRFPFVTAKKTEKRARKLAQKMEKISALSKEAPAPGSEFGHSDVDKGTQSQNGDGVFRSLLPESSPGSAVNGECGEPSPGPDTLRAMTGHANNTSNGQRKVMASSRRTPQDEWNPMKEDYDSPSFNSYTKGPGMLMKQSPVSGSRNCTLYVKQIPVQLTRDGLANLFSRAGKVLRATVMKPKDANSPTTYGFVEFGTVRETDKAFQVLQNFDMGDGIKLKLKVSESKEQREKRQAKLQEERAFLNSLPGDSSKDTESTEEDDFEMDDSECADRNPFVAVINPKPNVTEGSSCLTDSSTVSTATSALKSPSKPTSADMWDGNPTSFKSVVPRNRASTSLPAQLKPPSSFSLSHSSLSSTGSMPTGTAASSPSGPPCTYCSAASTKKCGICKTPYCSPQCQEKDWPKHKLLCKKTGTSNSLAAKSPEKEKELSDDDDLDIGFSAGDVNALFQKTPDQTADVTPLFKRNPSKCESDFQVDGQVNCTEAAASPSDKVAVQPPHLSPLSAQPVATLGTLATDVKVNSLRSPKSSTPGKEVFGAGELTLSEAKTSHKSTTPFCANNLISYSQMLCAFSLPEVGDLPSLPKDEILSGTFLAFPTLIISSTQLSILPLFREVKARLETLLDYEKSLEKASRPVVEKVAKHAIYGFTDSRGQFFRVELQGADFSCVDTGCVLQLHEQDIFTLPDYIKSIPSLRHRGSMRDLMAPAVHTTQRNVGKQLLAQLIEGKVVLCKNSSTVHNLPSGVDILVMDVFTSDGLTNIGEIIHRKGHATLRQTKSQKGSRSPILPLMLAPQKGPTHYARLVPFHVPPSHGTFDIFPTMVVNPGLIFAQVFHPHLGQLKRLIEDLSRASIGKTNIKYVPSVGEICATQFKEDMLFYRAEVMRVNNNGSFDVHFVDYGNHATAQLSEVHHIQAPFLQLPKQALQFSIAGIVPLSPTGMYTNEACHFLSERVFQKRVKVQIVSGGEGTYSVDMFDPEDSTVLLKDLLIQQGYARGSFLMKGLVGGDPMPITIGRGSAFDLPAAPPTKPVPTEPKLGPFPTSNMACPSAVSSVKEKVARPDLHGEPISFGPKKRGHTLYGRGGCKSTDPTLDGRVQGAQPKTAMKSPESSSAQTWPPKVRSDRIGSSSCSGYTGSSISHEKQGDPTPKSPETSSSLLGKKPRYFRSQPSRSPQSKTKRHSCTTVSAESRRVEHKSAVQDTMPQSHQQKQVCQLPPVNTRLPSVVPRSTSELLLPVATLPLGCQTEAIVTDIDGLTSFHLVKADAEVVRELSHLFDDLQEENLVPLSPVSEGVPCIARDVDKAVYRARVVSVLQSSALIKFVDYGNTSEVTLDSVFRIDTRYLSLPAQAIHCTLFGASNMKSPGGQAYFLSTALNAKCSVFKVGEEQKKSSVKLWIKRNGKNVNFLDLLPQNTSASSSTEVIPASSTTNADDSRPRVYGKQIHTIPSHSKADTSIPQLSMFDDLKTFALPKTDAISALITEVVSPGAIYIQIATEDSAKTLTSLMDSVAKYFEENSPVRVDKDLPVGAVCCAKYAEDGLWYRVQVICQNEKGCDVQFIDFGNMECVQKSNLAYCPADLLSIPVMAIRCSLGGIVPRGIGFNSRAIDFLKGYVNSLVNIEVLGRKLSATGKKLVVRMTNSSNSADIARELLKQGLVLEQAGSGNSPSAKVTDTSDESSRSVSPVKPAVSVEGCGTSQSFAVSSHDFTGGPKIFYDVLVSDIFSPSSIQVQVVTVNTQKLLQDLQTQLSVYAAAPHGKPASFSPEIGSHCCAVFPEDSNWYRAEILSIAGDEVRVRYLDFGNCSTVSLTSILPLTDELAKLPCVAYEVSLSGITSHKEGAVKALETLLSDKMLSMKVIDAESSPMKVQLVDVSTDTDVAKELVKMGLATSVPVQHKAILDIREPFPLPVPLGDSSRPPPIMAESLPPLDLPFTSSFQGVVVHTDSLSNFYIQLTQGDNYKQILSLLEKIQSYIVNAPVVPHPLLVGELCIAKFDGDFYRAKVMESEKNGMYKLFFVDYGNYSIVPVGDVRAMTYELAKIPAQGVCCALVGIPYHYPHTAVEQFKKSVEGHVLLCVKFSSNPLIIDLELPDSQYSVRTSFFQSGLLPSLSDCGQFAIEHASFPASGESLLMVHDSTSPLDFWMQVHNSIAMTELGKLSEELQAAGSQKSSLVSPLLLGQLCVAKFQEDDQWYRAQVIKLLGAERVAVRFLDYGNVASAPADAVKPILPQHLVLPAQAINGALHGFGINANMKVMMLFESLTTDAILQGSLKRHVFPDLVVVELKEWDGGSLCEKLLQENASGV